MSTACTAPPRSLPRTPPHDTPVEHVFFENLPRQERETDPLPSALQTGKGSRHRAGLRREDHQGTPFRTAKPVVFYGTSITQGGCASRSGMSYQAILGRQLNLDFVNLGFSGNGKGEPVVAAWLRRSMPPPSYWISRKTIRQSNLCAKFTSHS